jgi:hypothetical protein
MSITYSECVFLALVIQHAKRMRRIMLYLSPVRLYHIFPHYLTNGTISEKKVTERKMCGLIFCTTFVRKFLFMSRTERDIIKKYIYIGLHVKYSLFVSYCIETRIFPIDFRKILKCQITRHVTPSCGSRDVTWGQTDGQIWRGCRLSQIYECA